MELRNEISGDIERLISVTFDHAESDRGKQSKRGGLSASPHLPPAAITGLYLTRIIVRHSPEWLKDQPQIVERLLKQWRSEERRTTWLDDKAYAMLTKPKCTDTLFFLVMRHKWWNKRDNWWLVWSTFATNDRKKLAFCEELCVWLVLSVSSMFYRFELTEVLARPASLHFAGLRKLIDEKVVRQYTVPQSQAVLSHFLEHHLAKSTTGQSSAVVVVVVQRAALRPSTSRGA